MLVTLSGITTLVKEWQPLNVQSFISVIELGITNSVTSSPFRYSFAPLLKGFDFPASNVIPHHWSIVPVYFTLVRD